MKRTSAYADEKLTEPYQESPGQKYQNEIALV